MRARRFAVIAGGSRPSRIRAGFTLLEILLVLVIIGIVATTAIVGFSGFDQTGRVQSEAERLALAIELARQKALRRNEIWGLFVNDTSYSFKRRESARDGWLAIDDRAFAPWATESGVRFEVRSLAGRKSRTGEARNRSRRPNRTESAEDKEEAESAPELAIYPGGEITPLRIVVSHSDAPAWVAQSDGIERVRAMPLTDAERAPTQRRWR